MFTTLTPTQLQAATQQQIAANVAQTIAAMTKRDLVVALTGSEQVADPPVVTRNKAGELLRQVDIVRDAETGKVLSSRVIDWTYYDEGPVKDIAITEGTEKRTITHFMDGRQPVVKQVEVIDAGTVSK